MQKCDYCNNSLNWAKVFKANWLGYQPIQCEECNSNYKITVPSRFTFVSLTILPMMIVGMVLLLLFPQYFFGNLFVLLMLVLIIPIIGSLVAPFLVKFRKIDSSI